MPAEFAQLAGMFFVIGDVALKFLFPELDVALRGGGLFAAFVPVPEAAVDKDDGFVSRQYDVGFPRQLFDVFSEAVAGAMQHGADKDFGFGICSANAGHIPRTALR